MQKLKFSTDSDSIEKIIAERSFDFDDDKNKIVREIVKEIQLKGDQALKDYTKKFDGAVLESLTVSEKEIEEAYQKVDDKFLVSLRKSIENVSTFHSKQLRESWFNSNNGLTGQKISPLEKVGVYIPGGRAAYPSSAVMTVVPARTAGVDKITAVSPPGSDGKLNPYTLTAMCESGVDEIYKVGGAQAVAALAYGTETVTAVDKIVGPGNIYVTLAKKQVYGTVDIDMLAGPSEILVLADSSADPSCIAADLLSQAEHDPLAVSILITDMEELIEKVEIELEKQLKNLPKEKIARRSLDDNGLMITVEDIDQGIKLVNSFAPEHFEIVVKEAFKYLPKIRNAGAIFIGEYSPEPLGDYMAGPNHVLPTSGTARYASPLNIDDFLKKSSIIYYQEDELAEIKDDIIDLAELEGLTAHAEAVKKRFEEK